MLSIIRPEFVITTLDDSHPNTFASEQIVEDSFLDVMQKNDGPILVSGSGSNIDRIVSLYNASKRAGRTLVLDLYQIYMLEALQKHAPGLPPHKNDHIQVYYPSSQLAKIKDLIGNKDFFRFNDRHINIEKLDINGDKYVFRLSGFYLKHIAEAFLSKGIKPHLVYSMWKGYMEKQPLFAELEALTESQWKYIHTSGHAYLNHLQSFASAIEPKTLIPIHTLKRKIFPDFFENVTSLDNGEPFYLI